MSLYFRQDHHEFNNDVKILQGRLNRVRQAFECNWDHLTEDGYFGLKTDKAVRAFQVFSNISPDGIYGGDTQAALENADRNIQVACYYTPPRPAVPPKKHTGIDEDAYKIRPLNDPTLVEPGAPEEVTIRDEGPSSITDILETVWKHFKRIASELIKTFKELGRYILNTASSLKDKLFSLLKKFTPIYEKIRVTVLKYILRVYGSLGPFKRLGEKLFLKVRSMNFTRIVDKFTHEYDVLNPALSKMEKAGVLCKMKFKAPGPIGILWKLKDVILAIFDFENYGTEVWVNNVINSALVFIEEAAIGALCYAAAAALVALVAGSALTGGALALVVAAVAAVLSIGIGYLLQYVTGADDDQSKIAAVYNSIVK